MDHDNHTLESSEEMMHIPGAIPIFGLIFQSFLKSDFHNNSSLETLYQLWETDESFRMS